MTPDMCDGALWPEPITCRQVIKWTTGLYITLRFMAWEFCMHDYGMWKSSDNAHAGYVIVNAIHAF